MSPRSSQNGHFATGLQCYMSRNSMNQTIEGRFLADEEKGEVSSLLIRPERACALLVLGHGASTDMRHRTMESIATAMADAGIATFRYNFPYSEAGGGRNANAVCMNTVRAPVKAAQSAAPDLLMLAGGHSFSGRMTSMAAAAAPLEHVASLVFFAFPLHPTKKPSRERALHLRDVTVPMLFLSGTRDALAERNLLEPTVEQLGKNATLHLLDTANHGFNILKRTRTSPEGVFDEQARLLCEWLAAVH